MIAKPEFEIHSDGPVVMVDDNDGDQLIARTCFERSRLTNPWLWFPGGPPFLAHLETVRREDARMPALVLLDINMPRMSGLEVLEHVRAIPYFVDLPLFCMLTSSTDPSDRRRAAALGASGFVVKPDRPQDYVDFFNAFAPRDRC